jgi:hypothetical protein
MKTISSWPPKSIGLPSKRPDERNGPSVKARRKNDDRKSVEPRIENLRDGTGARRSFDRRCSVALRDKGYLLSGPEG